MGDPQRIAPGEEFEGLRIIKELGRGAFATVFLAKDTLIGRQVALKVMRGPAALAPPEERERILREARLVAKLSSAHIVTLYRVHRYGDGGWAFEMEYVDGETLDDRLKDQGRVPIKELLRILRGTLIGLRDAHAHAVIHRDVKPGNVLLGKDGSVKLADFGLGRTIGEASLSASTAERIVGTPLYMAPEVLQGDPPTLASDLWSVGVILYRMISGRHPFQANNLLNLFIKIQNADPPPLKEDVPRELCELAMRCLSKRSAERPASTDSMLGIVDRIVVTSVDLPREAISTIIPRPRLVGRDKDLKRLDGFLEKVAQGGGATVLVTGEAGVGKSTLVQEAGLHARKLGFRWLEANVTPVSGLLRSLLQAGRHTLEAESGTGGFSISAARFGPAAPLLRGLMLEESPQDLQSRQQTVWAVEQMLVGLAKESPVGFLIEDTHLCDSEDVRLLREMIRRLAEVRVFLAITYRTYDPESSDAEAGTSSGLHNLTTLPQVVHVNVGPLSADEIFSLLEDRAEGAHVSPIVAEKIIRTSEGSPMYALELFRHLEEVGEIVREGDEIGPGPQWGKADLPRRLHDVVARRLDGLTEAERTLLDAAAVDGLEFDGDALAAVVERPLLGVLRSLQHLYRKRGLVVPRATGYRFSHALFQDVIYEDLAPDLRREIHNRLAEHLESRAGPVDPERLGLHWERAGDPERARPHLIRAADAAASRQEVKRTIDLCRRAGLRPDSIDQDTALEHADTLFHLAASLKDGGRPEDAEAVYQAVIRAAQERGDEDRRIRAFVLRARHRYYVRGLEGAEEEELVAATQALPQCRELGLAHWLLGLLDKMRGNLERAAEHLSNADSVFVALGNDADHSTALDELASVALRRGQVREAEALYADAARVSAAVGRRTNAATSELNRDLAAFRRGAFDNLEARMKSSIRTLELEGATNLALHAQVFLADVLDAKGETERALDLVRAVLPAVARTNYLPGREAAHLLEARLLSARGELDAAAHSLTKARELAETLQDLEGRVIGGVAEAQRLCFAGCAEAATAEVQAALALASGCEEPRVHVDLLIWTAETVLYGLDPAVARGVASTLGRAGDEPAAGGVAAAFLGAALEYAEPTGSPEILRVGSTTIAQAEFGPRRSLLCLIADWLEAEAEIRSGNTERGHTLATEATNRARGLGHVWITLSTARIAHGLKPDADLAGHCRDLLSNLAAAAADTDQRTRIQERWGI